MNLAAFLEAYTKVSAIPSNPAALRALISLSAKSNPASTQGPTPESLLPIAAMTENFSRHFPKNPQEQKRFIEILFKKFHQDPSLYINGKPNPALAPNGKFCEYLKSHSSETNFDLILLYAVKILLHVSTLDKKEAAFANFPPHDLECLGGSGSRLMNIYEQMTIPSTLVGDAASLSLIQAITFFIAQGEVEDSYQVHVPPFIQVVLGHKNFEETRAADGNLLLPKYFLPADQEGALANFYYQQFRENLQKALQDYLEAQKEFLHKISGDLSALKLGEYFDIENNDIYQALKNAEDEFKEKFPPALGQQYPSLVACDQTKDPGYYLNTDFFKLALPPFIQKALEIEKALSSPESFIEALRSAISTKSGLAPDLLQGLFAIGNLFLQDRRVYFLDEESSKLSGINIDHFKEINSSFSAEEKKYLAENFPDIYSKITDKLAEIENHLCFCSKEKCANHLESIIRKPNLQNRNLDKATLDHILARKDGDGLLIITEFLGSKNNKSALKNPDEVIRNLIDFCVKNNRDLSEIKSLIPTNEINLIEIISKLITENHNEKAAKALCKIPENNENLIHFIIFTGINSPNPNEKLCIIAFNYLLARTDEASNRSKETYTNINDFFKDDEDKLKIPLVFALILSDKKFEASDLEPYKEQLIEEIAKRGREDVFEKIFEISLFNSRDFLKIKELALTNDKKNLLEKVTSYQSFADSTDLASPFDGPEFTPKEEDLILVDFFTSNAKRGDLVNSVIDSKATPDKEKTIAALASCLELVKLYNVDNEAAKFFAENLQENLLKSLVDIVKNMPPIPGFTKIFDSTKLAINDKKSVTLLEYAQENNHKELVQAISEKKSPAQTTSPQELSSLTTRVEARRL